MRAAIIIPTLNEAPHIQALLECLRAQSDDRIVDVIVADGGSDDGTCALVEDMSARWPLVRLLHNPARIQSAGINKAVASLDPSINIILRVDAHAAYGQTFLTSLLSALEETGADSVVVRLKSGGDGCFQRATGAVSNTIFGTGGAVHRMGVASGFVDHGHHAAMRRASFDAIGGYDETFSANEDAEFDLRLAKNGGRIWFAAEIVVDYFPRTTLPALARQYYRYGFGRAQTQRKHRMRLRARQVIPPAILAAIATSLGLAVFSPWFLIVPAGYFGPCALVGVWLALREKRACFVLAGAALPAMHLPWAAGFWISFMTPVPRRRVR